MPLKRAAKPLLCLTGGYRMPCYWKYSRRKVPARSSGQARLLAEGAHGLKGILKIMRSKAATAAALSATALLLAACSREQPTAEPSGEQIGRASCRERVCTYV